MTSSSVFNMDNFTVTRRRVPDPGGDSSVAAIGQGAGSGSRITATDFLQAPHLAPGQDQVLVHSGDQSIVLDQNRRQWVNKSEHTTIHENRQTLVDEKEEYVNRSNYTRTVGGPFLEEHLETTREMYHEPYETTYFSTVTTTEHHVQIHYKNRDEKTIQYGNSDTWQMGQRTFVQVGANINRSWGLRSTMVLPFDLKIVPGIDLGFALIKHTTAWAEGKIVAYNFKTGIAELDFNATQVNSVGALIRPGIACVKAALLCVGNIRW